MLTWADCSSQLGDQHSFSMETPGAGSPDSSTWGAKCWQTQPWHKLCCQGTLCTMLREPCLTLQRRHHCWFKSTLDCSCRNQGQYFGQASHLDCSNTPFQATATGYYHRRDIGLGGPSTAEVIVVKEHCKRKYTSPQIKFFRYHTGNNLACRTLATRVESHAVTSRSACLTELLSWIAISHQEPLWSFTVKYSVQKKNYFQVKAGGFNLKLFLNLLLFGLKPVDKIPFIFIAQITSSSFTHPSV